MASSTRSCMLFTWSMYVIAKWSPVYQGASNVWNPRLAVRYIFTRQPAILPYSDKRKQVTNHPNLRKLWFLLDLAYSTSIPSLEQKHSSCWKIFKSRHHDIALMSMYKTDTFCSFTRNFIFKSCFLLSEYGSIPVPAIISSESFHIPYHHPSGRDAISPILPFHNSLSKKSFHSRIFLLQALEFSRGLTRVTYKIHLSMQADDGDFFHSVIWTMIKLWLVNNFVCLFSLD